MLRLGIKNGLDLKNFPLKILEKHFGKIGYFYYNIVRGIDDREVVPFRERKSIGSEKTFAEDIADEEILTDYLKYDCEKISQKMEKYRLLGKTITLKLKYANFDMLSKSLSFTEQSRSTQIFIDNSLKMLDEIWDKSRKIRLLGISISNLINEDDLHWEQLKVKYEYDK